MKRRSFVSKFSTLPLALIFPSIASAMVDVVSGAKLASGIGFDRVSKDLTKNAPGFEARYRLSFSSENDQAQFFAMRPSFEKTNDFNEINARFLRKKLMRKETLKGDLSIEYRYHFVDRWVFLKWASMVRSKRLFQPDELPAGVTLQRKFSILKT